MHRITVFVGSNRTGSYNLQLANALKELGRDILELNVVDPASVPHFDPNHEEDPTSEAWEVKRHIKEGDGVLIVSPEYNRSIPPLTKSIVDIGSRPYADNSWAGKPVALAGASIGAIGTAVCQSHLRSSLTMLGAVLMGQPEVYLTVKQGFFTPEGNVASEGTRRFLHEFLERFNVWVGMVKGGCR